MVTASQMPDYQSFTVFTRPLSVLIYVLQVLAAQLHHGMGSVLHDNESIKLSNRAQPCSQSRCSLGTPDFIFKYESYGG